MRPSLTLKSGGSSPASSPAARPPAARPPAARPPAARPPAAGSAGAPLPSATAHGDTKRSAQLGSPPAERYATPLSAQSGSRCSCSVFESPRRLRLAHLEGSVRVRVRVRARVEVGPPGSMGWWQPGSMGWGRSLYGGPRLAHPVKRRSSG
jgi:hypothetical protein